MVLCLHYLWENRPLEPIYTFVWLDAIHYKIKDGGKYETKAVYTILGIDKDGKKRCFRLIYKEKVKVLTSG